MRPTAIVADDEPLLAASMVRRIEETWPELEVLATPDDGLAATALALELAPDVVFLDIRMPGRDGLEVAQVIADEWPEDRPQPLLVFVTAHGEFALPAFERQAFDYVLKPVTPQRMEALAQRLKRRLAERRAAAMPGDTAALLRRLQSITGNGLVEPERLRTIRASVGNAVHMIRVEDILCLEAADKYVSIVTANVEALLRSTLRDLLDKIDFPEMVQIHRGAVVNLRHVSHAERDEVGNYRLVIRGLQRQLRVSRAFAHQFRPMQFG